MNKQLEALTMERRLAAHRLAIIAGKKDPSPAAPPKPKPQNGKPTLQASPVLSLNPK